MAIYTSYSRWIASVRSFGDTQDRRNTETRNDELRFHNNCQMFGIVFEGVVEIDFAFLKWLLGGGENFGNFANQ